MLNYRSRAILKREIVQQIFTKKFIVMTLSFPLIMLVIIGLQIFIATFDREESSTLRIVNESESLQALVRSQIEAGDLNNAALYTLQYDLLDAGDDIDAYVDREREALLSGNLTGIVHIPDSAREDKQLTYYSTNPANQILQGRLREAVGSAIVEEYFDNLNVDRRAIEFVRTGVRVDPVRVSREGNTDLNPGNLVVAFGFSMLIYISLLAAGPTVMAAVNEEKTNRIVEVLLSSVSSEELLYGKILGTAITGLLQMLIWLSPVVILSLVSLPSLIALNTLDFQLGAGDLLYFLLNYLLALLSFLSIFAAFGAMFDTPQDAQGSMMPVMMLIIVPFVLTFSMARNPANTLAEVCSMLPFFNFLVMPARMTLIDVPLWQLAVAIAVNLLTFWLCIRAGAKIYRITILMTGKRPSWPEVYKWLRYA